MPGQTEPILYSFRRCPYAMRARLALAVSETRCELREVKLSAKPEAMLKASPKGTVPVLILPGGEVIDQSIDIMRRTLAMHDPQAWLARDDAELIATNDGPFKRDLDGYKYPERHETDPQAHRDAGVGFLRELEARIAPAGQLCGAERGLTDMAIMPFIRQFAAVDREWFDTLPLPALKTWLAKHLASDLFQAIMLRLPPWSPGNEPVVFPSPATH